MAEVKTRILPDFKISSRRTAKQSHLKARKVEHSYARKLKMVARVIGDIVKTLYDPENPENIEPVTTSLYNYAKILTPWAEAVGARMIAEVNARDRKAWADTAAEMAAIQKRELRETDIGFITRARLADQIDLITSLPRDAAERVHKLTLEGLTNATRASQIAKEIMRSGDVSRSRALLIATTEVSRTHVEFQRARAESIGSTQFIWRTAGDSSVRPSHRALNGKVFEWNNPPLCDAPSYHALPGGIFRCRCWAEPLVEL